MTALAVVLVLAALAVPQFAEMSYKSRRAEIPLNINGFLDAEVAYASAYDKMIGTSLNPTGMPGKTRRPWLAQPTWQQLGWAPDGDVYADYQMHLNAGGHAEGLAWADIDGDSDMFILDINIAYWDGAGAWYGYNMQRFEETTTDWSKY